MHDGKAGLEKFQQGGHDLLLCNRPDAVLRVRTSNLPGSSGPLATSLTRG